MTADSKHPDDATPGNIPPHSGDGAMGGVTNDASERLPEALARDLQTLYAPRLIAAPQMDERIRAEAQRRFAAIAEKQQCDSIAARSRRVWVWRLSTVGGVAAAVAFAVLLRLSTTTMQPNIDTAQPIAQGDIDGSGRIDIVDAFTLARRIDAGSSLDAAWDINADGVIDQRDVDAIAHQAVQLPDNTGASS